jgi:hypothetical protein
MNLLIRWADNRTSNYFIYVHVAALGKGHERMAGAS